MSAEWARRTVVLRRRRLVAEANELVERHVPRACILIKELRTMGKLEPFRSNFCWVRPTFPHKPANMPDKKMVVPLTLQEASGLMRAKHGATFTYLIFKMHGTYKIHRAPTGGGSYPLGRPEADTTVNFSFSPRPSSTRRSGLIQSCGKSGMIHSG